MPLGVTSKNYATLPPGEYPCGNNLYLVVAPSGRGRWLFSYQRAGLKKKMGLGAVAIVTLKEAQDLAIDNKRLLAQGLDPRAVRDERRAQAARQEAPRFAAYATDWRKIFEAGLKHRASRAKLARVLDVFCAPLHKLGMDEITTEHIVKLVLAPRWKQVENARDTRQTLNRLFCAAIADDIRKDNPADWLSRLKPKLGKAPKRGRVRGHHKAISYYAMPALWARLAAAPDQSARTLQVLLLTAARTAEILHMQWSQLDLDAGLWTIKAADVPTDTEGGEGTKNQWDKITPLSRQAVAILRGLEQVRVGEYVFPGRDLGGPMSNMTMLKRLKDLASDPSATVHGLRGSFRTWAQDEADFAEETVEHCMHHITGDASAKAYKHGKAIRKRRAVLQAWADFACKPPGEVIPLSRVG
jgi:integrase